MNNKQYSLMGSGDGSWLEEVDGLCFTFSHMPQSNKWCSLTGHDGNAAQWDKRIEMNKYNREGRWLDWWMDEKEGGELSTQISKLKEFRMALEKLVEEKHVLCMSQLLRVIVSHVASYRLSLVSSSAICPFFFSGPHSPLKIISLLSPPSLHLTLVWLIAVVSEGFHYW